MEHRVMLVERNRLMLEKLSNVIRHTEGMELVVRYQDISDALGQGIVFHADLILLDVEGVDHSRRLTRRQRLFVLVNVGRQRQPHV